MQCHRCKGLLILDGDPDDNKFPEKWECIGCGALHLIVDNRLTLYTEYVKGLDEVRLINSRQHKDAVIPEVR